MPRADFNDVVNYYAAGGPGVVGPLLGNEPGRLVTARYIFENLPWSSYAETYITVDGAMGPFSVPASSLGFGTYKVAYVSATIFEMQSALGTFYQMYSRDSVILPSGIYLRYHVYPFPIP